MFKASKTVALICLVFLSVAARAQAGSPDVQKIISQLNTAATKFVSAQADFDWDQLQAVVQEHDIQSGTIYFERKKGDTRMAADLKRENGKAAPKTVVYDNGQVQYYLPSTKQLTILEAGAKKNQWESFLTLGFGGSGDQLEANWKVSVLATESMNGVPVAKLDLVPLQQTVLDMFSHVTIWVDPVKSVSYKQIFYEPSGDMRTAVYKNIRYNSPIPAEAFHIKLPPDATTVRKQP